MQLTKIWFSQGHWKKKISATSVNNHLGNRREKEREREIVCVGKLGKGSVIAFGS